MKKNSTTSRIVVFVLFLAIITAIVISGTFAKYTETKDGGTATANIAKWSFDVHKLDGVSRTDGIGTDLIADKKLAPGTSGTIDAEIDLTNCEVAVEYTVKVIIDNVTYTPAADPSANPSDPTPAPVTRTSRPTNLKFYSDAAHDHEISCVPDADGKETYTITSAGSIAPKGSGVENKETAQIYWEWPYYTNDSADIVDTEEGTRADDFKYTVEITATQVDPRTSTPAPTPGV